MMAIKFNNIPMITLRLLLVMHLHKRQGNYFARRDYDVPLSTRIIAIRFYNTHDPLL